MKNKETKCIKGGYLLLVKFSFAFPSNLVLLSLLIQVGCASVNTFSVVETTVSDQVTVAQVDQWIEEGKLSQAHQALDRQTEENPEWKALQERKKRLDRRISAIEHRVLSAVNDAQMEEDWPAAKACLEDGRAQLPHSQPLKEAETLLNFRIKGEAEALERKITLVRAEYLQSLIPLMQQMDKLGKSGWGYYWRDQLLRKQQKKVLRDLLECSDFALVAQDLPLAQNCLSLANRIDPLLQLDDREALLATLKSLPDHNRQIVKTKKQSKPKKKTPSQSEVAVVKPSTAKEIMPSEEELAEISSIKFQFQQHFYLNEWQRANQLLQTLEERAPRDSQLRSWRRQLDKQINQAINIGLNEGENYYSQGLLDQALATWHDLLELDPENLDVRERIERTERFIEKLNRLKSQEAS